MSVYRLTPIAGTESNDHWRASSIVPQCVWVDARDGHEAREIVALATIVPAPHAPGAEIPMPPWNDPDLVACAYDDGKIVPSGIIRVRYETVHPIDKPPHHVEADLRV